MIWLYLQKPKYRPCDLDLWPMKVNYFVLIDYHPISVLHKFQCDISTNSREIKYQNIENSLSLIIGRFVSMATKKIYLTNLKKKNSAMSWVENTSVLKKIRTIGPVVWPVQPLRTDIQTDRQTNRGDQYTLRKVFRLSQSNEKHSESADFAKSLNLQVKTSRW